MNTHSRSCRAWTRTAAIVPLLVLYSPTPASCSDSLFTADFEEYETGSNLRGQGGWDGLTNQGTASEVPIQQATHLVTGKVMDTRSIVQADRIHVVGHALPALDSSLVSVLSADVYALADSVNTGFGIGENPSPGLEFATDQGFFADFRASWTYGAAGWYFDLRGIAGVDASNFFLVTTGADKKVTLKIVVDGPAGIIYGELDDGALHTTASRPISAGQISAIDAVAMYSDRSLPGRNGLEFDNFELTVGAGKDASPCGDVNRSGALSASDALAVLKAAVGQPIALQCPPPARPLRTGQTTCHNADGSPLTCIDTAQDGELQLGIARHFIDNGDGTISDAATGLMWEKLSADDSIHDYRRTYTWLEAFEKASTLNTLVFAGHSDWRVPNVRELETLRDFNIEGDAIPAIFREPCDSGDSEITDSCAATSYHWTSTTWSGDTAVAWVVLFESGTVDASLKNTARHVRAVRAAW